MAKMKIECEACSGTGLYSGFAEPRDVAVVCNRCAGSGHGSGHKAFTGRKRLKGIATVWGGDGGMWMCRGKDYKPKEMAADEWYAATE